MSRVKVDMYVMEFYIDSSNLCDDLCVVGDFFNVCSINFGIVLHYEAGLVFRQTFAQLLGLIDKFRSEYPVTFWNGLY